MSDKREPMRTFTKGHPGPHVGDPCWCGARPDDPSPGLEPSKPKTIRVRIAVCVAADGSWSSCGWSGDRGKQDDSELASNACDIMPSNAAVHFIEADIPLPQTIEAEVAPGDDRVSIASFAQREAARFDREAESLNQPGAARCRAIAGELRTFAAQIKRGDDRSEVQS